MFLQIYFSCIFTHVYIMTLESDYVTDLITFSHCENTLNWRKEPVAVISRNTINLCFIFRSINIGLMYNIRSDESSTFKLTLVRELSKLQLLITKWLLALISAVVFNMYLIACWSFSGSFCPCISFITLIITISLEVFGWFDAMRVLFRPMYLYNMLILYMCWALYVYIFICRNCLKNKITMACIVYRSRTFCYFNLFIILYVFVVVVFCFYFFYCCSYLLCIHFLRHICSCFYFSAYTVGTKNVVYTFYSGTISYKSCFYDLVANLKRLLRFCSGTSYMFMFEYILTAMCSIKYMTIFMLCSCLKYCSIDILSYILVLFCCSRTYDVCAYTLYTFLGNLHNVSVFSPRKDTYSTACSTNSNHITLLQYHLRILCIFFF